MDALVDKIIECKIEDIPFDEIPINERFGLIVYKNNVKYEFLIHLKSDSKNLVCFGSGALNGSDLKRFEQKPRFNRQSWKINESTLFYNDPTRYLNNSMLGGWGIGTTDDWYLENIKEIILKIKEFYEIKNENILFYGSSLGGFTSMLLGTLVKDSKVLADVPQLTFENAKYFQHIKHIVFPDLSDEEIKNNYNYRLNVLDLIKKEKYIPNAYIIFDAGEIDIKEHYTHFFAELNKITECNNSNRMKIIINPINEHKFMSMEETLDVIQQACDNNLLCFGDELYSSDINKELEKIKLKIEPEIIEVKNEINAINEITAMKNTEIHELDEIITQKDAEIHELNLKNKQLEIKFNEISTSTTWKLTKPLRKFLDLFKK